MEVTNPRSWTQLPAEIWWKILSDLIQAAEQDGSSLAPYATVSWEWQAAVEAVNFRSLNFTLALMAAIGFEKMAHRAWSLGLVRRVCIFVPLPQYGCPDCEVLPRIGSTGEVQRMKAAAQRTLCTAFWILASWKRGGDLLLDITMQSASDADHYFKHMDVGRPRRTTATTPPLVHDPRHGWENGQRVSLPPGDAILRLFNRAEIYHGDLPRVTAVTRLVLRRQTTRRWDLINLEDLVFECVNLKEFHFEPWRGWTIMGTYIINKGKSSVRQLYFHTSCLSIDQSRLATRNFFGGLHRSAKQLTTLVLFEDFSDAYIAAVSNPPLTSRGMAAGGVRRPCRKVSRALARSGGKLRNLEHLSAAFLIDATHFLPEMCLSPPNAWASLASLTITSRRLAPEESTAVNDVFAEAARAAAARLPALQLLELWNARAGLASVLRYRAPAVVDARAAARASILWRATWNVELERRVIEMWERVACRGRPCELRVVIDYLDPARVKSHGDAIPLLGFDHDVVEPVSLEQIQRENRH